MARRIQRPRAGVHSGAVEQQACRGKLRRFVPRRDEEAGGYVTALMFAQDQVRPQISVEFPSLPRRR